MQFNVSRDKKIQAILELMAECEYSIYRDALALGIDPETITYSWTPPSVNSGLQSVVESLQRELSRHQLMKEKLTALG